MDKPITVEILIDDDKYKEKLSQITPDQRKKVYAILGDIENHTGMDLESLKRETKKAFIKNTKWQEFSLSDCDTELAGDYIDHLIELALDMDVPLKDSPRTAYSDTDRYLEMCLRRKICAICGKRGEVHHAKGVIGMGRDRTKVDDSKSLKICLCRTHHSEAHNLGMTEFQKKYHVYGIIWTG